jgi:penicillin-insensitive murein endopeptidase
MSDSALGALKRLGLLVAIGGLSASGCLGIYSSDGYQGALVGDTSNGAILGGAAIATEGTGYRVHRDWIPRHRVFSSEVIAQWVVGAFANVDQRYPGSCAYLGDLAKRGGGGVSRHRSHTSGRDIDFFFYARSPETGPLCALPAMPRFDAVGNFVSWASPRKRGEAADLPPSIQFDVERNWMLVESLLGDARVSVQWIFIAEGLADLLLEHAKRIQASPRLIALAGALMRQPSDAAAHDDHMHVRVFCAVADRAWGCVDKGPKRWWKKHWKWMAGS